MPNTQGASWTMADSGGETSTVGITTEEVTALNLVTFITQIGALENAIDGLTLGTFTRKQADLFANTFSPALNTAPENQRENKYLVRYHDTTTGQKYRIELPTADLSLLPLVAGKRSEFLDITVDPALAFCSAFATAARSPNVLGPVVVDSIQFVGGRN